jgi:hypothetical protein
VIDDFNEEELEEDFEPEPEAPIEVVIKCPLCIKIHALSKVRYELAVQIREITTGQHPDLYLAKRYYIRAKKDLRKKINLLDPKEFDLKKWNPEEIKENKAKIVKRELLTAEEVEKPEAVENLRCKLLDDLAKLDGRHQDVAGRIRKIEKKAMNTDLGGSYQAAVAEHRAADQSHPRCDGCSLLFGSQHLATESFDIDEMTFCQFCHRDYERMGEEKFLARIKVREAY